MERKKRTWAPILNSVEDPPGRWLMLDEFGKAYGEIRIIRADNQVGYKAKFRGELVGYFTALDMACNRTYEAYIKPKNAGPPNGRPAEPRPQS